MHDAGKIGHNNANRCDLVIERKGLTKIASVTAGCVAREAADGWGLTGTAHCMRRWIFCKLACYCK